MGAGASVESHSSNRRLAGLSRLAGLNRQAVMEADEGCLGHSSASIRYASKLHRSPSSV
jgi:hypothetical protein